MRTIPSLLLASLLFLAFNLKATAQPTPQRLTMSQSEDSKPEWRPGGDNIAYRTFTLYDEVGMVNQDGTGEILASILFDLMR